MDKLFKTVITEWKQEGVNLVLRKKLEYEEKDEDDTSIYSKDGRDSLLDDDELTPREEAFMAGYEEAV